MICVLKANIIQPLHLLILPIIIIFTRGVPAKLLLPPVVDIIWTKDEVRQCDWWNRCDPLVWSCFSLLELLELQKHSCWCYPLFFITVDAELWSDCYWCSIQADTLQFPSALSHTSEAQWSQTVIVTVIQQLLTTVRLHRHITDISVSSFINL